MLKCDSLEMQVLLSKASKVEGKRKMYANRKRTYAEKGGTSLSLMELKGKGSTPCRSYLLIVWQEGCRNRNPCCGCRTLHVCLFVMCVDVFNPWDGCAQHWVCSVLALRWAGGNQVKLLDKEFEYAVRA